MSDVFFKNFLMISEGKTILFILILFALFYFMWTLQNRKTSFSTRVLTATGLGLGLGVLIQIVAGFPDKPMGVTFISETTKWYGLFGNGFIDMIRMLVIPLIMVSIVHVIINMKGANLRSLTRNTIVVTMVMVSIAAIVGLAFGLLFNLGAEFTGAQGGSSQIKDVKPIADTLRGLLPANPVASMVETNIIALVIVSALFGVAALRMSKKYMDVVKPFFDLVNALHKIIISVAMTIIKFMPFAVIAMLANTIAQRGMKSILEVLLFIVALYVAIAVMFVIQLIVLAIFGISPGMFLKKGLDAMIMAFTSRSSVGTLPLTISTLTRKMGVSEGTANFVASFGSTAGMQGCAGVFPALLVVFVANLGGSPIDVTFLIMCVIVIAIGSLGIAGIPGTATMAASVALSGTGMASSFPLISPILAIDPLIDMGRTFLNVTGAMVNALIVDKRLGSMDMEKYNDPSLVKMVDEESASLDH